MEADLILEEKGGTRRWIADVKSGQTAKALWSESLRRVSSLVAGPTGLHGARQLVIYDGQTRRDWPADGTDFLRLDDAIADWQTQT